MKKNYVLAMVLSFVVLCAYIFVQTKFIDPKIKTQPTQESDKVEQTIEVNEVSSDEENEVQISSAEETEVVEVKEEKFDFATDKLHVTFTNRGGDITSIELVDHKDNKTKSFVQMAENVTDYNRAFSLSLGSNDKNIVDDFFMVKENNPNNAQLIFTSHNNDIMDLLGRYRNTLFVKEDNESFCYRLDEPKAPYLRNDRPVSVPYKRHLVGGYPKIGN